MRQIAICDSDKSLAIWIKDVILVYFDSFQAQPMVHLFHRSDDLLFSMHGGERFQLILLEVTSPNGMQTAREVRWLDPYCLVILTAASSDYAIAGYTVKAFDYLLKPLTLGMLTNVLDRVIKEIGYLGDTRFTIKTKGMEVDLQSSTITFVESVGHYIEFHSMDERTYRIYGKLNEYEKILTRDPSFIRCHQSFLINMKYVSCIKSRDFIINKQSIPIRKSDVGRIKKEYFTYLANSKEVTCDPNMSGWLQHGPNMT